MNRISQALLTVAAIREAASTELRACIDLIRMALMRACYPEERPEESYLLDVVAIYPDHAVIKKAGRYWSYPYVINEDNTVTLGEPEEVIQEFQAVTLREAEGAALTGPGDTPLAYEICIVQSGRSVNKNYYPDSVLRESAAMFDGVRVFCKSDAEHLAGINSDLNTLVGHVEDVRFVAGAGPDTGRLVGTVRLLESASPVPEKIAESYKNGTANDLFGFSIDAMAHTRRVKHGGETVREAVRFTKVKSVDLIIDPSAGGEIIRMLESVRDDTPKEDSDMPDKTLHERMVEAVKSAHNGALPADLDPKDDAALMAAYQSLATPSAKDDDGKQDDAVRLVEARFAAREAITAAALPDQAKERLRTQLTDGTLAPERVAESITAERDYLAAIAPGGRIEGLGDPRVEPGESRAEKVGKMLDAFFDHKDQEVISIKECYIDVTGDTRVTGALKNCDLSRLREARGDRLVEAVESSTWAEALGDSLHRRLLSLYNEGSIYDLPTDLVDEVPAVDFRDRKCVTLGGYGDLPTVAESGTYGALTSPGDDDARYKVTKKGGTETITLETIKNDDVGAVMRMPMELNNAAKRTLSKSIYAHLSLNGNIYDGKALFHADHKNLSAGALSATSAAAVRLAQRKQTRMSTNERMGIPPRHLWVPDDLEETAYDLFRRGTNNDPDFVESLRWMIHPVWCFTDTNNWYTSVDKMDVPIIELAYLDNQRMPELFVQDMQNVGSMFTNDRITYKIRHIYGSAVVDYRGLQGAIVA